MDLLEKPDYLIGLDLGQTADPTALAVLERPPLPPAATSSGATAPPAEDLPIYALRHLDRFPLGTPYPDIVVAVAQLTKAPPLGGACRLIVDQTGVGRAVVDLLRRADLGCPLAPITITSGSAVRRAENGEYHVAKKELVGALQVLLQTRRLQVAQGLPLAAVLVRELQNFRVKVTAAANEVFEAWREGDHDDLVLATALAAWWAEQHRRFRWQVSDHIDSLFHPSRVPKGVYGSFDEDPDEDQDGINWKRAL